MAYQLRKRGPANVMDGVAVIISSPYPNIGISSALYATIGQGQHGLMLAVSLDQQVLELWCMT
jgi:hypothetical protein